MNALAKVEIDSVAVLIFTLGTQSGHNSCQRAPASFHFGNLVGTAPAFATTAN